MAKSSSMGRRGRALRGAGTVLAAACLLVAVGQPGVETATKNRQVVAANGMVASAHTLASQAGVAMLKAGGNAVDAAVAAAFAIGVAEPNATGIGGEGMMVIYLAAKKTAVAIDYRSAAPADISFPGGIPATGHAAVAVPGTVAGLTLALQKYGTLPLARVLEPAIRIAEGGFTVSATLAPIIVDNFEEIAKNEALSSVLCPGGLPLEAGATLKNPELGASLRKIARLGGDVFYHGDIAKAIAAEMASHGGHITSDDLSNYRAIERIPVRGSYRGHDLIAAPPPVGGMTLVEILQILENFDVAKNPPLSPANVHVMAEAMKRGFADYSAFLADPGFTEVPMAGLLSKPYAKARAAEIDPAKLSPRVTAGEPAKFGSPSTTSLSTVDRRGNMVALTQTLSDFFGAKVSIAGTGIILNNEMKNFSSRGVNAIAPGKRMRTTISPTIMLKAGRPFATLGTPGAARIISTMTLIVSNLVDFKMGIQEAIEAPRFYARDTDTELSVESRIPAETREALSKMGYNVKPLGEFDLFFGGAQGIVIDARTGRRVGGADPRRDGAVIGY